MMPSVRPRLFVLALVAGLVAVGAGCDNAVDVTVPDPLATPPGWTLVWADEFDGTDVDPARWSFQTGDGCPSLCGWGNNELQRYTTTNHTVAGGLLTINARREADGSYTSTRLRTLGNGDWTYGRFEIRAKLPTGQGLWPAIWMLFSQDTYGGWAASGEIDIMEAVGSRPDEVFGTIHYGGTAPANVFSGDELRLRSGTFADDFYVFTIEWEEGEIRWYVNNVLFLTKTSDDWFTTGSTNPAAPFDHDFYMLLNVAVGGNLPGPPDETTVFPQTMQVDYVRVYERDQ
jgi:beta-glucanase (GH16 family)